jgi:hypothetical protein
VRPETHASQPPDEFRVRRAEGATSYRRRDDVVAVTQRDGARHGPSGPFGLASAGQREGLPVYARPGVDEAVVPTGRVFVRARAGAPPPDYASLGYTRDAVPEYAADALWLKAPIGTALANLDALCALPGVEHAEPELLTPKALR